MLFPSHESHSKSNCDTLGDEAREVFCHSDAFVDGKRCRRK